MVVDHDNNKNMVQGDKLELKCEVTGYPVPVVVWVKDDVELKSTDRISFQPYKDSTTGQLKIFDLDYADDGNYSCVAKNEFDPLTAKAYMKVRVKGKSFDHHLQYLDCHPYEVLTYFCWSKLNSKPNLWID